MANLNPLDLGLSAWLKTLAQRTLPATGNQASNGGQLMIGQASRAAANLAATIRQALGL